MSTTDLCPVAWKLYDKWDGLMSLFEDKQRGISKKKMSPAMKKKIELAWNALQEHREECEDCKNELVSN